MYHLLLIERLLSFARELSQLIHLRLQRLSLLRSVLALLVERVGFGLQLLEVRLRCDEFCVSARNLA